MSSAVGAGDALPDVYRKRMLAEGVAGPDMSGPYRSCQFFIHIHFLTSRRAAWGRRAGGSGSAPRSRGEAYLPLEHPAQIVCPEKPVVSPAIISRLYSSVSSSDLTASDATFVIFCLPAQPISCLNTRTRWLFGHAQLLAQPSTP